MEYKIVRQRVATNKILYQIIIYRIRTTTAKVNNYVIRE